MCSKKRRRRRRLRISTVFVDVLHLYEAFRWSHRFSAVRFHFGHGYAIHSMKSAYIKIWNSIDTFRHRLHFVEIIFLILLSWYVCTWNILERPFTYQNNFNENHRVFVYWIDQSPWEYDSALNSLTCKSMSNEFLIINRTLSTDFDCLRFYKQPSFNLKKNKSRAKCK